MLTPRRNYLVSSHLSPRPQIEPLALPRPLLTSGAGIILGGRVVVPSGPAGTQHTVVCMARARFRRAHPSASCCNGAAEWLRRTGTAALEAREKGPHWNERPQEDVERLGCAAGAFSAGALRAGAVRAVAPVFEEACAAEAVVLELAHAACEIPHAAGCTHGYVGVARGEGERGQASRSS